MSTKKKIIKDKKTKTKKETKIKPTFESTRILPHKIKGNNVHMSVLKLNPDDDNSLDNIETFVNSMRKNFKGVTSYQVMVTFDSGKSSLENVGGVSAYGNSSGNSVSVSGNSVSANGN